MVEVVEAMIGFGPASFEARASASRLRSSTSGTPSKMTAAEEKAACASFSGTTLTRDRMVSTLVGSNMPKVARLVSTPRMSASASASSFLKSSSLRALKSTSFTG